jgi:hypothetical protein
MIPQLMQYNLYHAVYADDDNREAERIAVPPDECGTENKEKESTAALAENAESAPEKPGQHQEMFGHDILRAPKLQIILTGYITP